MNDDRNKDWRTPGDTPKLGRLPFFAELPHDTLRELERLCRPLRFEPDQIVAHEGDHPSIVGCVQSGILRMQKTLLDGRQHIAGLLVEGDMFGRVFGGPLNVSIEAATRAEICAFPIAPFEALLMRAPELDRMMLLNVLNELDRARDWMMILANPRIKGRLAGFLLVLCTRFSYLEQVLRPAQGVLEVHIPIGRADLAHLLGTRPESISRAFHALADSGHITIRRPDLIEIRDIEALSEEAGGAGIDVGGAPADTSRTPGRPRD